MVLLVEILKMYLLPFHLYTVISVFHFSQDHRVSTAERSSNVKKPSKPVPPYRTGWPPAGVTWNSSKYHRQNDMHCCADIAPWISFDRHCMSDVAANKLFTFIWTFITDNCQSIGKAAKSYGRNSSKCHRLVDKIWYWTWFCEIEHSV